MDIVAIERVSFDSFRKKLEQIVSLADNISLSSSDICIEKEWIEGKTLAASLNIPLRTLQSLRENGKLSFSTVGKKVYYKVAEVQKLLDSGRLNSTCKCNRILINNLFKFFVWREVSKSFTRSIIEFLSSTYKCNFLGADNKQ